MVSMPITVPRKQQHVLRLLLYLVATAIIASIGWRDIAVRVTPAPPSVITVSAPTAVPVCRVTYVQSCDFQSSTGAYRVVMGATGPRVATGTP